MTGMDWLREHDRLPARMRYRDAVLFVWGKEGNGYGDILSHHLPEDVLQHVSGDKGGGRAFATLEEAFLAAAEAVERCPWRLVGKS